MLKKLMWALAALVATMGIAFAQVDVNKADQAALGGVKGIGSKTAQLIVGARTKGGNFKDWADFEKRVKGIGEKRAARLSAAGLTVNGHAHLPLPATAKAGGKRHAAVAQMAKKDMKK